jgi:ABC-2 type transport system permease protein
MHRFWGIVHYEYLMTIRRWGFWLACGLVSLLNVWSLATVGSTEIQNINNGTWLWNIAGLSSFYLNLFLPVVAGISIADRLVRDERQGPGELLRSTPLTRTTYILGKYFGALLSILTPIVVIILAVDGILIAKGVTITLIPVSLLAFLIINIPAFAFLTAFSLACPLIMPVRVYQVLFTGYWFWGNFLNNKVFPTLNGTLLTASGNFAFQDIFGGFYGLDPVVEPYAGIRVIANIGVLILCIVAVMVVLNQYFAWQARKA